MANQDSNQNPFGISLLPEQLNAPGLDVRSIQYSRPTLAERGIQFQKLNRNEVSSETRNLNAKKVLTKKSPDKRNKIEIEKLLRKQMQIDNQEFPIQQTIWRNDIHRMKNVYQHIREQSLGNIPLAMILGWVHQESSGRLDCPPKNALDEIGWFQISKEERQLYLHLSSPESRIKILNDPDYSAKMGLKLTRYYQQHLENNFGITESSPAVWKLVRLSHQRGIGAVRRLIKNMLENDLDPSNMSWENIKLFVAEHPQKRIPLTEISKVDYGFIRGLAIENYLKQFQTN